MSIVSIAIKGMALVGIFGMGVLVTSLIIWLWC